MSETASSGASGAAPPKPKGLLTLVRQAGLGAGVAFGILGLVVLLAGPALYRAGMLGLDTATSGIEHLAMRVFAIGLTFALAGLVASLVVRKQRGAIVAIVAGVACGYGVGHLYGQGELRKELPPIYDAQTDWTQPVAFSEKLLAAREAANAVRVRDDAVLPEGEGEWSGMTFADAQTKVYDLAPITVRASVPDATVAAAKAAQQLGWSVMLSDPQAGAVEAVNHTFWYGLVSDIAVRITPDGQGARVDIRSTSRDPGGDMGANAAQVKALLNEIALMLR